MYLSTFRSPETIHFRSLPLNGVMFHVIMCNFHTGDTLDLFLSMTAIAGSFLSNLPHKHGFFGAGRFADERRWLVKCDGAEETAATGASSRPEGSS